MSEEALDICQMILDAKKRLEQTSLPPLPLDLPPYPPAPEEL